MTDFDVVNGEPVPKKQMRSAVRKSKYPFADMEIGSYFPVTVSGDEDLRRKRAAVYAAFRRWRLRNGTDSSLVSRRVSDNEIRFWRM